MQHPDSGVAYVPIKSQIIEREPVHAPVLAKKLPNQILVEANQYRNNLRGDDEEASIIDSTATLNHESFDKNPIIV